MKRFLSILFFAFIFMTYLSAQDYYTDDFKDFTFEMPDGWETTNYPGLKYKIICGDSVKGYNQNMIFISEEISASIDEVVEEYITGKEDTAGLISGSKIISHGKFENNYNIESRKLIMEVSDEKNILKQYFYLFRHNNILYICAATLPDDTNAEIVEMLDASMKTFQIFNKKEEE
ncbi:MULTISPECIES: hypothetical protein [unclassified Treponema]|uniref:hypothetical protein n=1 Tax=unclassified Treponema TaxID=2638727 RepID=UPI0020A476DF|nr:MULTISPECIES: hypothetical protein [unclassified Treponema]UTC67042.1 hypothetical protein E4O06_14075 [Treponema sp. OMZ 789]UTC69773.1 hypothetical protein E4O01_14215 [Treponema sp. OMZ 790]UTC72487.1 hypothetical protein E4O02_14305 [Treponema sp. OMZ 791]